ncbi:MAG: M20/M25/M40 family metallo-hydrolase [Tepidisphaeraceae bacterium]
MRLALFGMASILLLAHAAIGAEPATQPALADRLHTHVSKLAGEIGPRGVYAPAKNDATVEYIEAQLRAAGYEPTRQSFDVPNMKVQATNIIAEKQGSDHADEIIVLGAHHDSVSTTPGADDNASGVAGLLESARMLKDVKTTRTIRFVFFANEEPPFFQTERMGSLVYAKACKARGDKITAMVCYEMLGYYSDAPNSQHAPAILPAALKQNLPTVANFLSLVTNVANNDLVERCRVSFQQATDLPVLAVALPEVIEGVDYSDHWSFWRAGYPAIMATDTSFFRNDHYHGPTDKPDTLDYARMAKAVEGLTGIGKALAE